MRKLFLIFISLFFVFFVFINPDFVQSQNRFATCDLCGYCLYQTPPSNWESCRRCLYPEASANPQDNQTLLINPVNNLPPTPYPGRWYTFLGCISTNLGSFEERGAAGSVVNQLLRIISSLIGGASLISLLYGAFILLTSQNNPEKITQGKKMIFGAIAGLIFAISAVFIIGFIGGKILQLPGFQSTP